jgi:hypothetical protein
MRYLLLIGSFLITLFFGLGSIFNLRIHLRTGMKSFLFGGIGFLLGAFTFLGMTIVCMRLDLYRRYLGGSPSFLFLAVGGVAVFMTAIGEVILNTSESGLWKEIGGKTTLWQRITGNVPILKDEKLPSPAISKRTSIIIGIIAMTLGSLIIIPYIVFKIPTIFRSFFIAAVLVFISGLLLVIFSIIYLDKGKKSPE